MVLMEAACVLIIVLQVPIISFMPLLSSANAKDGDVTSRLVAAIPIIFIRQLLLKSITDDGGDGDERWNVIVKIMATVLPNNF